MGEWQEDENRTIFRNDGHVLIIGGKLCDRTKPIIELALMKHAIATVLVPHRPDQRLQIRFSAFKGNLRVKSVEVISAEAKQKTSTNGDMPRLQRSNSESA